MTLSDPNPGFKVTVYLQVQSYYRTLIGNHTYHIEWYHVWWPWLTSKRVARLVSDSWVFLSWLCLWIIILCPAYESQNLNKKLSYRWQTARRVQRKYCDLQTGVRGHWRSLEMSPFDTAHATSDWCSIVTMDLSSVVSEISDVDKCHDLEIRVRGHSRSLKVLPFDGLGVISY